MKTINKLTALLLLASSLAWEANAQLAITEVMAESATDPATNFKGPDFWELTNFGTNDIDLDGYGFSDNNVNVVYTEPFTNLFIHSGESIIFCRSNSPINDPIDTVQKFRRWWGEQNLPADLQVRFYVKPGFDADVMDEVWLRDRSSNVVDMVAFGSSRRGHTLTYETAAGQFGVDTVVGVDRAFRAATSTNDIGSPGFTGGPVPLFIVQPPASQTEDGCGSVAFAVLAGGLPRPRYQWTSNGIPILNATGPTFHVANVDPSSAGEYGVKLDNSLAQLTSPPATLTVNTNPLTPLLVLPPSDRTVFAGQTATFFLEVRGFPCLQFLWQSNGVAIPGATSRTLSSRFPSMRRRQRMSIPSRPGTISPRPTPRRSWR